MQYGTEQGVHHAGKLQVEGKDYVVADGDILIPLGKADVNHDGFTDLVAGSASDNIVTVFFASGEGYFRLSAFKSRENVEEAVRRFQKVVS